MRADYEHRPEVGHAIAHLLPHIRDRGQLPASLWLPGDYAEDGVTTDAELIVAADCRIGTSEAPLPTKRIRLWAPSRRAARIHESREYQGLEVLTRRSVHQPNSFHVDDSSRLAQWRLASPEPRGDVGVRCRSSWAVENGEIRGRRGGNPQSRQPERSLGGDRGIKSVGDF